MHWCKEPGKSLNNRSRMFEATYEPSLVSECCRYPSRRYLPHVKVRKLLNWSLLNLIYRSIDEIAHTSASREAEPNIRTKHSQLSNNALWEFCVLKIYFFKTNKNLWNQFQSLEEPTDKIWAMSHSNWPSYNRMAKSHICCIWWLYCYRILHKKWQLLCSLA